MNKLLENPLLKHDLFSIDAFVCKYGNLGFLHPKMSLGMTFFDCNEETEILESEFDDNKHFHAYFINYDEVLPIFDFGMFYNATAPIFSDLSHGFRKELRDYLLTINDLTTKKQTAYEIKLHFISIGEILLSLENLNPIQKEVVDYFIAQYNKEIEHLDKLCVQYSESFSGDSDALNDEILQSVIERILVEKTADLTTKVNTMEERMTSELLSIKEAQKFLGVGETTFWRMRKSGLIPEYMLGAQVYFKSHEIVNCLVKTN
ncbi:helix-turn-helix domain-containing protein [Chryseobacterium camelliae]|uniref:Helix-turn-helix domain-containing protein n=1 Tax=Chryseobacterium camelliae TaxID=1265445 RepID=A0ABY7QLP3_9FLAO|nr:helix-turn-helix domain-containing protein [Chryseobacterium camelliae]WBV59922.1 helix-turn-helix domain-containing protein [Chryseobacterium camelliae]